MHGWFLEQGSRTWPIPNAPARLVLGRGVCGDDAPKGDAEGDVRIDVLSAASTSRAPADGAPPDRAVAASRVSKSHAALSVSQSHAQLTTAGDHVVLTHVGSNSTHVHNGDEKRALLRNIEDGTVLLNRSPAARDSDRARGVVLNDGVQENDSILLRANAEIYLVDPARTSWRGQLSGLHFFLRFKAPPAWSESPESPRKRSVISTTPLGTRTVRRKEKCQSQEDSQFSLNSAAPIGETVESQLVLMTWNVGAEGGRGDFTSRLCGVAAAIKRKYFEAKREEAAFVVALQEFVAGPSSEGVFVAALRHRIMANCFAELPSAPLRFVDAHRLDAGGKFTALIVCDRFTIESSSEVHLGSDRDAAFNRGHRRSRAYTMQTARLRLSIPGLGYEPVFVLGSAHVECTDAAMGGGQFERLKRWVRTEAWPEDNCKAVVIVAGDFNTDLVRVRDKWVEAARGSGVSNGLRVLLPQDGLDWHGWPYGTYHGYHNDGKDWVSQRTIDGAICSDLSSCITLASADLYDVPPRVLQLAEHGKPTKGLEIATLHAELSKCLMHACADHFPVVLQLALRFKAEPP